MLADTNTDTDTVNCVTPLCSSALASKATGFPIGGADDFFDDILDGQDEIFLGVRVHSLPVILFCFSSV